MDFIDGSYYHVILQIQHKVNVTATQTGHDRCGKTNSTELKIHCEHPRCICIQMYCLISSSGTDYNPNHADSAEREPTAVKAVCTNNRQSAVPRGKIEVDYNSVTDSEQISVSGLWSGFSGKLGAMLRMYCWSDVFWHGSVGKVTRWSRADESESWRAFSSK